MVDATQDRTGRRDDSGSTNSALPTALLAELNPGTDLAWLVERVCRNNLPWVVVPASALRAWQQRDPAGWEKVSKWLAANGITIVRIEGKKRDRVRLAPRDPITYTSRLRPLRRGRRVPGGDPCGP